MNPIVLPSYIVGEGTLRECAPILSKYGKKAMIISGTKSLAATMPALSISLSNAELEIVHTAYYGGQCTYDNMRTLSTKASEVKAEYIIGIGGGKALDTAKGCADLLGLPIVTIPSIAATCAAMTAISVVYDRNGVFVESMFHRNPPVCAIIDISVIANAPWQYLRAGIGDAMAKHVECSLSSRNCQLNHSSAMAVALSSTTFEPNMQYAVEAQRSVEKKVATNALEQVVLANIVSTGLVSLLIDEVYNGAIAHALFYGMTKIPGFEKQVLHGDAVGYGILVQEMIDGQEVRYNAVKNVLQQIGIPTTFEQMGYQWTEQLLDIVVPATIDALHGARCMPYTLTAEMLKECLLSVEKC